MQVQVGAGSPTNWMQFSVSGAGHWSETHPQAGGAPGWQTTIVPDGHIGLVGGQVGTGGGAPSALPVLERHSGPALVCCGVVPAGHTSGRGGAAPAPWWRSTATASSPSPPTATSCAV